MLDEPLLLREEGSGTRVILEYYLKERGLAAADFARTVEIGNIGAIKTLLKSGYGVSFLYRAAIRPEEAAGTLCVIELSDFQLRHDIMFLFPKTVTSAPTTRPSFRSCAPVRRRTARARAPKREKHPQCRSSTADALFMGSYGSDGASLNVLSHPVAVNVAAVL